MCESHHMVNTIVTQVSGFHPLALQPSFVLLLFWFRVCWVIGKLEIMNECNCGSIKVLFSNKSQHFYDLYWQQFCFYCSLSLVWSWHTSWWPVISLSSLNHVNKCQVSRAGLRCKHNNCWSPGEQAWSRDNHVYTTITTSSTYLTVSTNLPRTLSETRASRAENISENLFKVETCDAVQYPVLIFITNTENEKGNLMWNLGSHLFVEYCDQDCQVSCVRLLRSKYNNWISSRLVMIRKQQQMVSVMVDISYWSIDTWKQEISADATSPGS